MGYAVASFIAVFVLIASIGLLLFYRETLMTRINDVIHQHNEKKNKTLVEAIKESKTSLVNVAGRLENMLPKSQAEVSVMMQRLTQAGYREESAVKVFYGFKVLMPLLLCAVAAISGVAHSSPFLFYAACLGIGFIGPDFWLGQMIKKRQKKIRRGLPDVLDLLVVCMEAGLSLDQSADRTAEELHAAQPEICDELGLVVLEQHAGRSRSDAWKNMAERTGEDGVRALVATLVQSEQLGTSVAKTLRVHSDTLRTQRIQMLEEMAAKTTVKLVFPLVFLIFPALFLVTLGPAVIIMIEQFTKMNQ
jgi:tight adherence protein C